MATASYCAEQSRRLDRDRFLCALFAPAHKREALFALIAFNAEIARARELVSEPILGSVRLQWWRDAIDAIYAGTPPAHPVAEALARAVSTHCLSRAPFDRLLDAREFDLDDTLPEDLPALAVYADATSAGLGSLALEILASDGADHEAAKPAVRAVGVAWGLTGLLRSVPYHARRNRIYLPKSLLEREGVEPAELLSGRSTSALRAVAREVALLAREHLHAARESGAPDWALPALLPATLADSHLARLERAGFDPFAPGIEGGRLGRQLRLWRAARRGTF